MRETICKVTCDKCGADIEDSREWEVTIERWRDGHPAWKADLCDECTEALSSVVGKLEIHARFSRD